MGLREEKKREQHRAILDTTVMFFRERGFEETRVRDVTGRLRISEGTFFNHFASKQAVLDAAARDLLERVTGLLHRDAGEDTRPAAVRLEEIVVAFATGFAGDREFAALLARHTQFFLGRWSETQWQEQAYRPLTRLLEDGQRRGEVRGDIPASQLAELYVGINLVTIQQLAHWLPRPRRPRRTAPAGVVGVSRRVAHRTNTNEGALSGRAAVPLRRTTPRRPARPDVEVRS